MVERPGRVQLPEGKTPNIQSSFTCQKDWLVAELTRAKLGTSGSSLLEEAFSLSQSH